MTRATDNDGYVFIDKDTGTVLGSNVVAVPVTVYSESAWEEISSSDSLAHAAALLFGETLYVE